MRLNTLTGGGTNAGVLGYDRRCTINNSPKVTPAKCTQWGSQPEVGREPEAIYVSRAANLFRLSKWRQNCIIRARYLPMVADEVESIYDSAQDVLEGKSGHTDGR